MRGRRGSAGPTGNVDRVSDDMPTGEQFDVQDDEQFDGPIPDDAPEAAAPELERWELPSPTGVPAVDEALAPLVELDGLPTGEHVAHYEAVHRRLQDALADLDSA